MVYVLRLLLAAACVPLHAFDVELGLPTDTMAFDSFEQAPLIEPAPTSTAQQIPQLLPMPEQPSTQQPPQQAVSPQPQQQSATSAQAPGKQQVPAAQLQPAQSATPAAAPAPSNNQPASAAAPVQPPINVPVVTSAGSTNPPTPAAAPALPSTNVPTPAVIPTPTSNPPSPVVAPPAQPGAPAIHEPTPQLVTPSAPLIMPAAQMPAAQAPTAPGKNEIVGHPTPEPAKVPQAGIVPAMQQQPSGPAQHMAQQAPVSITPLAMPENAPTAAQQKPAEQPKPIQAAPEEIKTEAEQKVSEEPEHMGIDTVNLTEASGNWLYKRIWWEKAQDRYEKIKALVDRAFETRMVFFNRRNKLEHTVFDPFYIHSGLGRGELEEILSYLMKQMEVAREKKGTLSEAERAFLSIMNKEKETLEQLRLDIEGISKLDQAVDGALDTLMEQLNLCRNYERKAWENFKQIAQELSDAKAKELYYGMVTYEENIGSVYNYIKHDFAQYFDQLVKTAEDNVERIQSTIKSLKEKGIDFKKQAQELVKQTSPQERERLERERLEREREEQEEAERQNSWSGWISGIFSSMWDGITGFFGSIYSTVTGWFGGSAPAEETPEETAEPAKEPETVKKEEEAATS